MRLHFGDLHLVCWGPRASVTLGIATRVGVEIIKEYSIYNLQMTKYKLGSSVLLTVPQTLLF